MLWVNLIWVFFDTTTDQLKVHSHGRKSIFFFLEILEIRKLREYVVKILDTFRVRRSRRKLLIVYIWRRFRFLCLFYETKYNQRWIEEGLQYLIAWNIGIIKVLIWIFYETRISRFTRQENVVYLASKKFLEIEGDLGCQFWQRNCKCYRRLHKITSKMKTTTYETIHCNIADISLKWLVEKCWDMLS